MAELDDLARQLVNVVRTLAKRAQTLATGVLLLAVAAAFACIAFASGGLTGTARSVMIVAAVMLGGIAAGAAWTARWRLGAAGRNADALVGEIRTLISNDRGAERTVIEVVEVDYPRGPASGMTGRPGAPGGSSDQSVIALSRRFFTLRDGIGDRARQFRNLTAAISAVTSFPGLIALSILVTFFLGGLATLLLLIWLV